MSKINNIHCDIGKGLDLVIVTYKYQLKKSIQTGHKDLHFLTNPSFQAVNRPCFLISKQCLCPGHNAMIGRKTFFNLSVQNFLRNPKNV